MAVKNPQKTETQANANPQTPDIAPAPAEATGANGATPNGSTSKRGPKGPRTSAPFVWSREMDEALVAILKPEKRASEIRTASVVAYELNKVEAFSDNPVTAQQVNSHVEALRTQLPKKGLPVPPWLALDSVKRQPLDTGFWGSMVA